MRQIEGVLYCNDGDWVESLSALVEHSDGRLELIDWSSKAGAAHEMARRTKTSQPTDSKPLIEIGRP
jgi:hypothetical protein